MATLPQLIEEDIRSLNEALQDFIAKTDSATALLIDRGGFLITHQGEESEFDLTTIAALASGAFMANQTIAGLVKEPKFNSIYQQGERFSMFVINVDEEAMLVAIFRSQAGVGVVKYFASAAVKSLARQLKTARERAPGQGLDLSVLNVANAGPFFKRK
ncbi:MAG TPA: roadblock/LC7 domain-containing protein [Verrucomicrobiae bacterium]|jgi:predicted regulator of Ras-like GTPase activity (Roadblock/LC7/MglB family)|nr:roadblock/LC7 domain-containing protein [Verrucomicrobiae bacterium]